VPAYARSQVGTGQRACRLVLSGPDSAGRRQRFPAAFDAASPANAAKPDAADALGALADEAAAGLGRADAPEYLRRRAQPVR
jgi:hypothetical protein